MGHSIVLSGRLSFPASRAAEIQALVVDPARTADWPSIADLMQAGARDTPTTAGAIVETFARELRAEVAWAPDALSVRAIVAAEGDVWLRGGLDVLALFRQAGALGASGGLAATGWTDGGPPDVISIRTKADGTSELSIVRGARAENAAKALHLHVAHLDASASDGAAHGSGKGGYEHDGAASAAPALPLSPAAHEHHQRVVAALRESDPQLLFEIARALDLPEETETFAFTRNPHHREPLTGRFRDAASLLGAFERGFPGLPADDAPRLAKRALELLARLDGPRASALAAERPVPG